MRSDLDLRLPLRVVPRATSCVIGNWRTLSLYKYRSLEQDQIRILELLPSETNGELHISLQTCHLEAVPEFEALISYEWGVPVRNNTIACGKGHILVTTNYEAALTKLRLPHQSRYLWIDAICIASVAGRDDG